MAQYRRTIGNLAPGPGLAVDDPRVGERAMAAQAAVGSQSIATQMAQALMAQASDRERMGLQASQFGQEMAARIAMSNADRAMQRDLVEKQLSARAQEGAQSAAAQRQQLEMELADRAAGRNQAGQQFGMQQSLQAQMANQQDRRAGLGQAQQADQFGQSIGLQREGLGAQKEQNLFSRGMAQAEFAAGRADRNARDSQWQQGFDLNKDQMAQERLLGLMGVAQQQEAQQQAAREMAWQTLGQDRIESMMGGDRPDDLQTLMQSMMLRDPKAAQQMSQLLNSMALTGARNRQGNVRLFDDRIASLGTAPPDAQYDRGSATPAQDRAQLSGLEFYDQVMKDAQVGPAQPSPFDMIIQQLMQRGLSRNR